MKWIIVVEECLPGTLNLEANTVWFLEDWLKTISVFCLCGEALATLYPPRFVYRCALALITPELKDSLKLFAILQ